MVWSWRISVPTPRRVRIGKLVEDGVRVLPAKNFLKRSMELSQNFRRGRGVVVKKWHRDLGKTPARFSPGSRRDFGRRDFRFPPGCPPGFPAGNGNPGEILVPGEFLVFWQKVRRNPGPEIVRMVSVPPRILPGFLVGSKIPGGQNLAGFPARILPGFLAGSEIPGGQDLVGFPARILPGNEIPGSRNLGRFLSGSARSWQEFYQDS